MKIIVTGATGYVGEGVTSIGTPAMFMTAFRMTYPCISPILCPTKAR